ncbi:MAG: diacylglycerol kinase family protein [Flavonifractor plautii]
MKKLLFLYNTHAGKGLLKSRLAAVQDALAAAGWDVTIHPTQGAGDATAVAAARAGEFNRIVCSGGDGTLHEVVAGLMGLEPAGWATSPPVQPTTLPKTSPSGG